MDDKVRAAALPRYEIGTVARLAGVSPARLRAWERRYGLGPAHRDDNGRRLYSRLELEHIQLVAGLVREGKRIGEIARLPGKTLTALRDQQYLQSVGGDKHPSADAERETASVPGRRRFSREQLARGARAQGADCECIQHLAELVQRLYRFEDYVRDCAVDNWREASLHATVYSRTAEARDAMEQALAIMLAGRE